MPLTTAYKFFLRGIGQRVPQDGGDTDGGAATGVNGGSDEPVVADPDHEQRYLWCIDAGHDEAQDGKRSPRLSQPITIYGKTYHEYREYIGNRDIAERLIELLSANGVAYMRTLPPGTKIGSGLKQRVNNANNTPSLLPKRGVSIHSNAGPGIGFNASVRGVETWHYSKSQQGRDMVAVFQLRIWKAADAFARANGYRPILNRGIKHRTVSEFYVLKKTNYPNVLTETLFFTNPEEVKMLSDPAFRQAIAEAHFDAIMDIETTEPADMMDAVDLIPWLAVALLFISALASIT